MKRKENNSEPTVQSASSTAASIRRSTKPTATPTRTRAGIIEAILKISTAALQVEDKAPPLPCDDDDVVLKELTMFANDCSVLKGWPNEATLLCALSPSNEFKPLMYFTLVLFWEHLFVPTLAARVTVAGESVTEPVAIAF